jgi:geranylgeranyl diphosphate synthase type II
MKPDDSGVHKIQFFDRILPAVDASLDSLLPAANTPPAQIHQAMRYTVFAGGKRLRPALCIAAFELFQPDSNRVLPIASTFEMIHTYSLVHDDLPAMDNDDFRRGLPSCHKKFGEAIAILAGDALLTLAFEVLGRCDTFPPGRTLRAIQMIARAAGCQTGMIAGQVFDLEGEHRPIADVDVEQIHRSKTAALITAAVTAGAHLGGAREQELYALQTFGECIGLAFQIVDDILDETQSTETLGKTKGKDRRQEKATYPAKYGVDRSRVLAADLTNQAHAALSQFGDRATTLQSIAGYLETRSH